MAPVPRFLYKTMFHMDAMDGLIKAKTLLKTEMFTSWGISHSVSYYSPPDFWDKDVTVNYPV